MKVNELFEAEAPVKKEKPYDGSDFNKKLTYANAPAALDKIPTLERTKPGGRGFRVVKGVSYTPAQFKKLIANLQAAVTDGTWIRNWHSPGKTKEIFVDWNEENYGTKATVMFDTLNAAEYKGKLKELEKEHDRQSEIAYEKSKGTGGGKGYFLRHPPGIKSGYIFATIDEGPRKGEPVGIGDNSKTFKKGDTIYINYGSTYGHVKLHKEK